MGARLEYGDVLVMTALDPTGSGSLDVIIGKIYGLVDRGVRTPPGKPISG